MTSVIERARAAWRAAWRDARTPERAVLAGFGLAIAIGFAWGLPNSNTWAIDSMSPRSCGLGAIVETYWPGHFHTYPPLHMALLTFLSLPWVALAAVRAGALAGAGLDAVAGELIKPLYMTGIEVSARALAAAMALGLAWNTMRLWTRIDGRVAGIAAGVITATNATLVYYAHTGNLEVPYLFWATWALVEMDRVMAGEPRERHAILFAAAAVLSKDQAAAALLLPLPFALLVVPWAARRASPIRGGLVRATVLGTLVYGVVSGALVNPVGFRRRVAFLLGPASQTWAGYPRGPHGAALLLGDAWSAIPRFTSWPVACAAIAGILAVVFARRSTRGIERARALAPLLAAVSFTLFFTLSARRSEDRFLLPQTLFALPYAGVVVARAWSAWPRARVAVGAVAAAAIAPAIVGVASMDGTLVVDSRYQAERFLAELPPASRVEVYGTGVFLPRIPASVRAVRPGVEAVSDRQQIPGVIELVDPDMDPRPRDPDVIVLATALSSEFMTLPPPPPDARPFGSTAYHNDASHRLFHGLFDGSLGYARALEARCVLPWPLECRSVHDATGRDVWIYARKRAPAIRP